MFPLVSDHAQQATLGAYLDDFFFVAPAERVVEIVAAWTELMTTSGSNLRVAPHKQECFSFQAPTEVFADKEWQCASAEGTTLLGCPVGTADFETAYWVEQAKMSKRGIAKLDWVRFKQSRMLLLRHCAVSRANFMLRSSAPDATLEAARVYDEAILERVAVLVECMPSDLPVSQVHLPLRNGCLGLTSAVDIRDAAFLGAMNDTAVIITRFFPLVSGMGAMVGTTGSQTRTSEQVAASFQRLQNVLTSSKLEDVPSSVEDVGTLPVGLQKRLSAAVASVGVAALITEVERAARLRSQSQRGAAAVWSAIPSEEGLQMNNTVFVTAVRMWLGMTILRPDVKRLRCACARGPELTDVHVLCCGMGQGRTFRHDAIVKTVGEMFNAAGFSCMLEPSGFAGLDPESGPDLDVMDYNGYRGSACIDVTVVNPLAPSHVKHAANVDLGTATAAETEKVSKYRSALQGNDRGIVGAALEVLGAFGLGWQRMMRTCSDRHEQSGSGMPFTPYGDTWSCTTFREYWSQRIAVQLRRGNEFLVSRVQQVALSMSSRRC